MSRKHDLAPTEIHEAMARAEMTCSAIACETDYEPPCLRGECHTEHCLIVANEAAAMAQLHELEHEARQNHEPARRHGARHGAHRHRDLTTSAGGHEIPEPQHSASSIVSEDVEDRASRYVMRMFELGSGFHYQRKGSHMRHLGNGGYMAVKKYP